LHLLLAAVAAAVADAVAAAVAIWGLLVLLLECRLVHWVQHIWQE
jgi:hypothetical protein